MCDSLAQLIEQFTSIDHTIKQRNSWVTCIEHDCMEHSGKEGIGLDLLNMVAWKHCGKEMHRETTPGD